MSYVRYFTMILMVVSCFLLGGCSALDKRAVAEKQEDERRGIATDMSGYGNPANLSSVNRSSVDLGVFRKIPAGKFVMGSPSTESGREKNEEQVSVEISRPFEIMETEVTQSQWLRVMKRNPSHFSRRRDCDNWDRLNKMCPDHPVESVSWNKVQEFIKRLNESKGLRDCAGTPQSAKGCYRLPTEAEWEYAVRAGTKTAYFFGDTLAILGRFAVYAMNLGFRTHKVKGDRLPNGNGLYDVYGNVWEWVQDAYKAELPGKRDPLVTTGFNRVIRGGSWSNDAGSLRSATRDRDSPYSGIINIGFRVVRTL